MTAAAVVLLEGELAGPAAAGAFAVAQKVAGDEARTLVLMSGEPDGALPAVGPLEVGVLSRDGAFDGDAWYAGVLSLLGDVPPPVIVFAAGPLCDAVAARLAGALGYSPVVDVEALEAAEGALTIDRSAFGGKASHRLSATTTGIVLATLGGGGVTGPPPMFATKVRQLAPVRGLLTETAFVPAPPAGLQAARVVVAGGRGVGEAGFLQVQEMAARLGAAVGASRAAVDAGWARTEQQVGLTGQTVTPEVYVAVGISGASQHLAGMSRSQIVLAINTDGTSPMADAADVTFVGDWHALWPFLQQRLPSPPPANS